MWYFHFGWGNICSFFHGYKIMENTSKILLYKEQKLLMKHCTILSLWAYLRPCLVTFEISETRLWGWPMSWSFTDKPQLKMNYQHFLPLYITTIVMERLAWTIMNKTFHTQCCQELTENENDTINNDDLKRKILLHPL